MKEKPAHIQCAGFFIPGEQRFTGGTDFFGKTEPALLTGLILNILCLPAKINRLTKKIFYIILARSKYCYEKESYPFLIQKSSFKKSHEPNS